MSDPFLTMQRQIQALQDQLERLRKADASPASVAARIYNSGDESINSGAVTTITFNNNRYDTTSISDANGFTIANAGIYHVGGAVRFAANATGQRVIYIILNGATFIKINSQAAVAGGNPTDLGIATDYRFAAADTVRLQVFQDSGGPLAVTAAGNYSPEFWIHRLA